MKFWKKPTKVYLDHAAATPPHEAFTHNAMSRTGEFFANPGGIHSGAGSALSLLSDARARAASLLSAQPSEILFTRGGTESCNMAIQGIIESLLQTMPTVRVLVNPLEHPAILEPLLHYAAQKKVQILEMTLSPEGSINLTQARQDIAEFKPQLVVSQYVNSETGIIQPIAELGRLILAARKSDLTQTPYFVCDAIQAFNYLPCNVLQLHVDILILSGSKLYGPRSHALLFKKRSLPMTPVLFGGGQESGLRPGTEDPVGALWLVEAMEYAQQIRHSEYERMRVIRTEAIEYLQNTIPDLIVNTVTSDESIPGTINISIPKNDSELLVLALDAAGYQVSSQSACSAKSGSRSRILRKLWSIQERPEIPVADIRISMGRGTTQAHMRSFVQEVVKISKEQRNWL